MVKQINMDNRVDKAIENMERFEEIIKSKDQIGNYRCSYELLDELEDKEEFITILTPSECELFSDTEETPESTRRVPVKIRKHTNVRQAEWQFARLSDGWIYKIKDELNYGRLPWLDQNPNEEQEKLLMCPNANKILYSSRYDVKNEFLRHLDYYGLFDEYANLNGF